MWRSLPCMAGVGVAVAVHHVKRDVGVLSAGGVPKLVDEVDENRRASSPVRR